MATSSIPQIVSRSTISNNIRTNGRIKVNPSNPMTKGQARLLFFAVKELTGSRLDLFSVNTPALVHSDITELCAILKKDSGATQEDKQLAINILVGDLRVPVLESTPRPVSTAGRAAAKTTPAPAPLAGKVGIATDKPKAKKMTPAQSLAKARAAKKAKAAAKVGTTPAIAPVVETVASPAPSKTAEEKLALVTNVLVDLVKALA